MNVAEIIEKLKVVPVIKLDDAKDAVPLGKALVEGGLPVAEITFRTEAAEEAIRKMSGAYPEIAVGAGTLTSVEQAKRALDAGASFFVSPGFHKGITEFAIRNNIPVYPGVCTPTELMMAMEYGLPVVKFFPAGQYGGLKTIKALSGPFPRMKFMPTGGINQGNIREYLAEPCVIACGGSWMVKDDMLKKQYFAETSLGISASAKSPDEAKKFVEYAVSEEGQKRIKDLEEGFPVNEVSLDQVFKSEYAKSYEYAIEDRDGKQVVVKAEGNIKKDDYRKWKERLKGYKTPTFQDAVIREMVLNAAADYMNGNLELDAAVKQCAQSIELYLNE